MRPLRQDDAVLRLPGDEVEAWAEAEYGCRRLTPESLYPRLTLSLGLKTRIHASANAGFPAMHLPPGNTAVGATMPLSETTQARVTVRGQRCRPR